MKAKKRWNGKTKTQRSRAMAEVAHHRWQGQAQDDDSVRQHFDSVPLDQALDDYAVMRRHYEIAGKSIDTRVQQERSQEQCENCEKKFDKDNLWYHREAVKDPATGVIRNIFACSQACMIAIKGKGRTPRP